MAPMKRGSRIKGTRHPPGRGGRQSHDSQNQIVDEPIMPTKTNPSNSKTETTARHQSTRRTMSKVVGSMSPSVPKSEIYAGTTDATSSPEPDLKTTGLASVEISDISIPPWCITLVGFKEDQLCEYIDIPPDEAYSYVVLPPQVKAVSVESATMLLRQIAGLTSICTKHALKARDEMIKLKTEMDVTQRGKDAEIIELRNAIRLKDAEVKELRNQIDEGTIAKVKDADEISKLVTELEEIGQGNTTKPKLVRDCKVIGEFTSSDGQKNANDSPGWEEVLKILKAGVKSYKDVPAKHSGFTSDSEDCYEVNSSSSTSWPDEESDFKDCAHVGESNEASRQGSKKGETGKCMKVSVSQGPAADQMETQGCTSQINVGCPGWEEVLKILKAGVKSYRDVPAKHSGFTSDSEDCYEVNSSSSTSWPDEECDFKDCTHVGESNEASRQGSKKGETGKCMKVSVLQGPAADQMETQGCTSQLNVEDDIPNKSNSKDPRFEITQKYTMQFICGMRPYITGSMDVEEDGNCGFRVVAAAMDFGRKHWRKVRTDLMNGLKDMPDFYEGLFEGKSRVSQLHNRLNHFASSMAPRGKWMDILDMGHLIATCYGVLVVSLSDGQCLTFLPLREYIDEKQMKADIHEIGIGFVNGNHFVQICFVPGHPLPPVPPNWIYNADNTAKILYQKYQRRFQQYIQLPDPRRVTNTSSKIIELDDDETTQFGNAIRLSEDTTMHLDDD